MDERSDEQLLRAFALGERAALGALAGRHESAMLGLARGLLGGSDALACEAVQESWVRVIRSARGFRGEAAVGTWLYRIVVNRCKDVRAREARAERRRGSDAQRDARHDEGETPGGDAGLRSAMDRLGDGQREVLVLCFGRGLTHREAAAVLGIPEGTVKSRSHGAMQALRRGLGVDGGAV